MPLSRLWGGTLSALRHSVKRSYHGDVDIGLKRRYLGLLREGVSKSRAASAIGMSNLGIRDAMLADRRFAEDVSQIIAERTDDVEEALYQTAMKGNVEAQKFWLTNQREDEWANRSRVEHTGRDGGPIAIATQATLALRQVLLDGDTRELAVGFIDAELAPQSEPRGLPAGE